VGSGYSGFCRAAVVRRERSPSLVGGAAPGGRHQGPAPRSAGAGGRPPEPRPLLSRRTRHGCNARRAGDSRGVLLAGTPVTMGGAVPEAEWSARGRRKSPPSPEPIWSRLAGEALGSVGESFTHSRLRRPLQVCVRGLAYRAERRSHMLRSRALIMTLPPPAGLIALALGLALGSSLCAQIPPERVLHAWVEPHYGDDAQAASWNRLRACRPEGEPWLRSSPREPVRSESSTRPWSLDGAR